MPIFQCGDIKQILVIKQKIYLDLEPHFVFDYIFFASGLRVLQSQECKCDISKVDPTKRAMHLVNLFELYQKSLEDLAAVTLAIYRRYNPDQGCSYQRSFQTNQTPLDYTLINYKPGEANLKKILSLFPNDGDILDKLKVTHIEEVNIGVIYPDINLEKFYNFFLVGLKSLAGDQDRRLKMFNKIKHGGVNQ